MVDYAEVDMSIDLSDSKWACIAAFALVTVAFALIALVHPGFEEQVGWFLNLLPGAYAAAPFAYRVYRFAPSVEPIAFWVPLVSISFVWYWTISFIVIKACRFVGRRVVSR